MADTAESQPQIDLDNPEVQAKLKNAYAIIARARARRLQREAEQVAQKSA